MEIIYLPPGELTPYAANAKRHPQEQVRHIANSIREFGFRQPIVVDANNVVVIGHGRLLAAKELGLETVPVVRTDDLTEAQINALRLADNKTNESEWDMGLLNEQLAELALDIDMSLFGFDLGQGSRVVEDEYDKPAPQEPKTRPGDVWQLGRHRLYCGDATIIDDVLRLMGGAKVDQLLTDPPYNVDLGGNETPEEAKARRRRTDGKTIQNDAMPDEDFRRFLADSFSNAKAVMKPGAAFYIWHAAMEGYNFFGALRDAGLVPRQVLLWEKNYAVLSRQDFQWQTEPCLYGENPPPQFSEEEYLTEDNQIAIYGWNAGGRHYWFKNRRQKNILRFDRPTASKQHPTMKPVLLFNYQMECNTKPGEIVLDLFAGSGTTIIAAEQNGRTAYCMEKDPRYADVIIDRWEEFTGEKAVLLN